MGSINIYIYREIYIYICKKKYIIYFIISAAIFDLAFSNIESMPVVIAWRKKRCLCIREETLLF